MLPWYLLEFLISANNIWCKNNYYTVSCHAPSVSFCMFSLTLFYGCQTYLALFYGCQTYLALFYGCQTYLALFYGCQTYLALFYGCQTYLALFYGCQTYLALSYGCQTYLAPVWCRSCSSGRTGPDRWGSWSSGCFR